MSIYSYNDLPRSYKEKIKCADCMNLDKGNRKRDFYGKDSYYCKERKQYIKLDTHICPSIKIDSKIANSYGGYRPSGFYIATAIIDIINNNGMGNHYHTDFVKENINKFFEEELEKNVTCYDLLLEYDIIAPELAMMIKIDPNNYEYAVYLYNLYLLPVAISVAQGQIEDALIMYIRMVQKVNNKFSCEQLKMDDRKEYDLDNRISNDLQITLEDYYGEDIYVKKLTK